MSETREWRRLSAERNGLLLARLRTVPPSPLSDGQARALKRIERRMKLLDRYRADAVKRERTRKGWLYHIGSWCDWTRESPACSARDWCDWTPRPVE